MYPVATYIAEYVIYVPTCCLHKALILHVFCLICWYNHAKGGWFLVLTTMRPYPYCTYRRIWEEGSGPAMNAHFSITNDSALLCTCVQ